MSKSFPKIIMILTLILSSFLMFKTVNYTVSTLDNYNELGFSSDTNRLVEYDSQSAEFKVSPYEEYVSPQAARTGPQDFCVILVRFSDYPNPRWTKAEHETIMQTIDDYWVNATYGQMSINWEVEGWYELGGTLDDYGELDGGSLKVDNWRDVVTDAVALADADIDFSIYENVIVMLGNVWWRGWSTLGVKIHINTAEGEKDVEATLVSERDFEAVEAVWGRVAHEMGHCFLLRHTHGSGGTQKNYASYYSLMARAYPSACNVYTQLIDTFAGWFDAANNQVEIAGGGGGTYHVRPRHLDINGDIQALKISISPTRYYRVEVCEQKSEDAWLPDEGVLIYYVDEGADDNDECTDMDSNPGTDPNPVADLQDCLYDVGDSFTDAVNGITISIDDFSFDGYDVTVTNSAGGTPDLMINRWGDPPGFPGPYETVDIYVDSPVNGWNWYRHNDGTGTNPVGNGDDPLLNNANRLHAKIHNIGDAVASGVVVKFYENRPIGAGASGTWTLIDTVSGLTINAGFTQDIYVDWTPSYTVSPSDSGIMDMHSCVKVVIDDHILEDQTGNNEAQENIDFFEVVPGAPMPGYYNAEAVFGTVSKEFTIVNPYPTTKEVYVNVQDATNGWTVVGNGIGEIHTFAAGESKVFNIEIIPNPDARFTDQMIANLVGATEVFVPDDNSSFVGDIHLTPFGGVTLTATIMYRSQINLAGDIRDEDSFTITGDLEFLDDVPFQNLPDADGDKTVYFIVEEVNTGQKSTANVVTDTSGKFELQVDGQIGGLYSVNVYYSGTKYIASSASVTLMVDLNASSIWTSKTALFPGFTFYLTLSGIVSMCVIAIIKRKRK